MIKENLISIITVVKNAEDTIEKCINSVVNQNYKNIQYIIIDGNSTDETKKIIDSARAESEKAIIEKTKKFHQIIEERKKSTEQKIVQLKENALNDIKNISIKISIEAVENLIKNSIDKNKLENLYNKSLEQAKIALKQTKA